MELVAERRTWNAAAALAVAMLIGGGALLAAVAISASPILAVAACIVLVGVGLVCRSLDWATFGVLFCLSANLAVVALKFHGVPALAAHAVVGLFALPLAYYVLAKRQP